MENELLHPFVSIIVPVYNTAEYVEECIQSILSQTYENIELILVNDGSTDGSGEICKKYEHLPNVSYFEQCNSGVVVSRKRGVSEAHGEWIMFVDSDDLLLEDGVQQIMLLSSGVDIAIGIHEGNTSLLKAPNYFEWDEYLYRLYLKRIHSAVWAKLFKRELFENCSQAFEYKITRAEDALMNLAIGSVNRKKVSICRNAIYQYRKRESSATHTFKYSFDYCERLSLIADSLVKGLFSADMELRGGINWRMFYYKRALAGNDFQGDNHHPFVKGIISRMNEARVLRLSDRMILYVSNRHAVRACLFLSKFVRRIENPSLFLKDFDRLRKKILINVCR